MLDRGRETPPHGAGRAGGRTRVLHVITRLIVGGAQENTLASVLRVDPERFESRLWIGPQAGSEGSLLAEAKRLGVEPVILPDLIRPLHPFRDARALARMTGMLKRDRIDILHTHSSKAGILGRMAARAAGVPVVVHTVHGWGFHDHMHPVLRGAYIGAERICRRWTDRLVAVSERTVRIGLEAGIGKKEDYAVIRSGIPLDRFHPDPVSRATVRRELGAGDGEVLIGSVGRLSPQKNPADFVRVAARIAGRNERARFLYIGDGPLREETEALARSLGLNDRIRFLGLRTDVPDLLRAMDIFLLTSLWEGLPRTIPQALATGVPVIAYEVSGIGEILLEGRNGHLLPRGDAEGMAEAAIRLAEDDALRAVLSRRALEEFDLSFSEDAMIRDLEDLYAGLAGLPRRSGSDREGRPGPIPAAGPHPEAKAG